MVEDSAFICVKPVCVCRLVAWIRDNKTQSLNSDRSREEMMA